MFKLFYSPGACSMAVHIALIEIKATFDLINVKTAPGMAKPKALLEVNPRGTVPVLKTEDTILREGVAILLYLLDNNPNDLLPKSGIERMKTLEWLTFANSTLHPSYSRIFFMMRSLGEDAVQNPLYKPAITQIQKYWDEIELHLKSNQFLTGDNITIADILVTIIANWSSRFAFKIMFGDYTKEYFTKVIARPSYVQALKTEEVKYSANL